MTTNMRAVEEANYGVYVWNVNSGDQQGILVNEDGDPLRINAFRGDLKKIGELSRAAAHYGFPHGEPVFWSGRRAISDSEYADQLARHQAGELADPYDIPALIEQQKRQNGRG